MPGLGIRERAYGIRSRIRRFRWELADGGRPLVRWFPRRWFTDPLALVDICSPWEAAWVERHCATGLEGTGAIVELGPWLGGVTAGILRGTERNPRAMSATVDAYDLFVFDDIEQRTAGLPLAGHLRDQQSFLELYRERLGPGSVRVRTHAGDVTAADWDRHRDIEFVFNDVAKTWEIWNHVVATFYPALRVGSTVVEQDWAHACTPWIHLWHHRWRAALEPVEQIPLSGSYVFRVAERLPSEAFEPTAFADYDQAEIDAAFEWATALVDPERRPNVRGALVQLYALHGDLDVASRICVREVAASRIPSELIDVALPELAARLADQSG